MNIYDNVAYNIRTRCRWFHVTQTELAEIVELTPTAFSARMNNRREWRLAELAAIAQRLNCSVPELVDSPDKTDEVMEMVQTEIIDYAARFGLDVKLSPRARRDSNPQPSDEVLACAAA